MKKKCKPTSTNAILWVLHSSVTTTFIQLKLNSCFSEGELLIQYFVYIFVWLTAIADHLLNTGCKLKAHKIFWRYQGSPRLFNISHQYFQFFNSPIILRSQSTRQADDNVSWYFFSKLIPLKIYGFPQIKKKLLCKVWKCPETTQRISKNQYPGALLLWRPYKIPHGTVRVGDP